MMFFKLFLRSGSQVCRLQCEPALRSVLSRRSPASSSAALSKIKSMDELQGPSFMTSLYWLFVKGYFNKTHQMQIEHTKIYGPLWKSKYGPLVVVNVASAELIEQVLRQEGKHPIRSDMPHWRGYRELRKQAYGPLTGLGAEWQCIRSVLNPRMLKPKHVSTFSPAINQVVTDFIQRVQWLREKQEGGVMVHDVAGELYKFAFEAQKLIDNKVIEIQEKVNKGEPIEGEYLTHLLVSDKMSITQILGSITELLLAGVDTTSNTISWALYHLAREPEIQEKLHREVDSVCPGDKIPTSEDIAKMVWLKAIVRETLRLYPVVPGNARVTAEKEIVVGDYIFPKKTLFHLCHYAVSYDECNFPEPQTFLPQRWLRGEERFKQHPFSSVPFGFGIRACLGKRVAELEMYCILSRLMKHFEVRPDPSGKTVKPITRTLLVPGTPISLQFRDRRLKQSE
ncbi:cytochrome P450 isoform X2 [Amia ocellicauda]|uniref:cytochrome P450 isoform X2 n=1 Tax=Amia ocellicauda TaxID=2972642 RepID=UPI003463BB4F